MTHVLTSIEYLHNNFEKIKTENNLSLSHMMSTYYHAIIQTYLLIIELGELDNC